MKFKEQLIILCTAFLAFFGLASCNNQKKASYPVYEGNETKLKVKVPVSYPKTFANGDAFDTTGFIVTFEDNILTPEQYYYSMSNTFPKENKIGPDAVFSSSERESQFVFYAVYETTDMVYVSNGVLVTVTNDKAVSKWLYITGTAVLFVAIGSWAIIRYKKK